MPQAWLASTSRRWPLRWPCYLCAASAACIPHRQMLFSAGTSKNNHRHGAPCHVREAQVRLLFAQGSRRRQNDVGSDWKDSGQTSKHLAF
uniref:Putative secreted protein n=1 Tax=Ixodes ricinus TaxID=34613 RepID=A0A6B0U0N6_IXORI